MNNILGKVSWIPLFYTISRKWPVLQDDFRLKLIRTGTLWIDKTPGSRENGRGWLHQGSCCSDAWRFLRGCGSLDWFTEGSMFSDGSFFSDLLVARGRWSKLICTLLSVVSEFTTYYCHSGPGVMLVCMRRSSPGGCHLAKCPVLQDLFIEYLLSAGTVLIRQSRTLLQEKEKAIAPSQCVDPIEQNKGCAQGLAERKRLFWGVS